MTISRLANAFIPGYAGHIGGPNGPIVRIVVHGTVSPTVRGGARSVARYFQSPTSGGLTNYVVDPGEIIACASEDVWVWGAPPNPGEIHVELCDPVDGDPARWNDADHQAMLHLAARLVADICVRHNHPIVQLDTAAVGANRKGITGHLEVSQAFRQSDHHDPGAGFPWPQFMALVSAAAQTGDDMPLSDDDVKKIAAALLPAIQQVARDVLTNEQNLYNNQFHPWLKAIADKVGAQEPNV